MVTTGYSKPYVAKYANTGSTVSYSGGMPLGRGVSLSLEIDTADDNNFYADNVVAETETAQFTSGSATITVDGLENDAATLIYGLPTPTSLTVDEEPVSMQGYGDLQAPYVGFGCIRRTQMNGVAQYWPLILPKIKFAIPSEEMNTAEDQIEWQTQELTATVLRDDTAAGNWKVISEEGMATEAEAYAAVVAFLGDSQQSLQTMAANTATQTTNQDASAENHVAESEETEK